VLIEKIYPRILKIRSDYFLVREVFNLQNSQAQDLYTTGIMPIPIRAWGNTLREVRYIDISGNYYKVNPYFLADLDLYQSRNLAFSASYTKGFIPFNSGIKLVPPPLQDPGSIEMHYIVTPSILFYSNVAGDGSVDITNMAYNTSTSIATYTTSNVYTNGTIDAACPVNSQALFDVYNAGTGMLLAVNLLLTRTTSTTFTGVCVTQTGTNIVSPNITELSNFQFGGYPVSTSVYTPDLQLVLAGTNVSTPVPAVIDNLLVYEFAMKILSAQGYLEELQLFKAEHDDLRKDLLSQMAMRVECEPYVIKNKRGIANAVLYGGTVSRRRI